MNEDKQTIIIGAGVAGLTTGIKMLKNGFSHVKIVELSSWRRRLCYCLGMCYRSYSDGSRFRVIIAASVKLCSLYLVRFSLNFNLKIKEDN